MSYLISIFIKYEFVNQVFQKILKVWKNSDCHQKTNENV